MSKIRIYESPYIVKGNVKLTGSQRRPKLICKDKIIGTLEGTGHHFDVS